MVLFGQTEFSNRWKQNVYVYVAKIPLCTCISWNHIPNMLEACAMCNHDDGYVVWKEGLIWLEQSSSRSIFFH